MNAQAETGTQEKKEKTFWEKLDVIFKAIAALSVAFVSVFGSIYLQGKTQRDAKVSLYVQLMTNRERADSDLRREMFDIVIKEFLEPKAEQEEEEKAGDEEDPQLTRATQLLKSWNIFKKMDTQNPPAKDRT